MVESQRPSGTTEAERKMDGAIRLRQQLRASRPPPSTGQPCHRPSPRPHLLKVKPATRRGTRPRRGCVGTMLKGLKSSPGKPTANRRRADRGRLRRTSIRKLRTANSAMGRAHPPRRGHRPTGSALRHSTEGGPAPPSSRAAGDGTGSARPGPARVSRQRGHGRARYSQPRGHWPQSRRGEARSTGKRPLARARSHDTGRLQPIFASARSSSSRREATDAAVRQLADHVIDRHYPEAAGRFQSPTALFSRASAIRQAELVARWIADRLRARRHEHRQLCRSPGKRSTTVRVPSSMLMDPRDRLLLDRPKTGVTPTPTSPRIAHWNPLSSGRMPASLISIRTKTRPLKPHRPCFPALRTRSTPLMVDGFRTKIGLQTPQEEGRRVDRGSSWAHGTAEGGLHPDLPQSRQGGGKRTG